MSKEKYIEVKQVNDPKLNVIVRVKISDIDLMPVEGHFSVKRAYLISEIESFISGLCERLENKGK